MSLISRKLLTPDEVLKIESPNVLVMIAGKPPALLNVPDISKMHFNKLNGMGTKEENQRLRVKRENERKVRQITKVPIWNIWDKVKNYEDAEFEEEQELRELRKNWRVNKKRKETFEIKSEENKDET